jgi:hypothetical protein
MALKQYLFIAVALVLGVGLGVLLFGDRGKTPGRDRPVGTSVRAEPPGISRSGAKGGAEGVRSRRGSSPRQTSQRLTGTLHRSVRERNLQLLRENKRLASRLSEVEQELRFAQGKPMAWPATSPPRLARKAVVAALNRSLREAGLHGEVTDVDCKEYPCVVSGNLKGKVTASRFQKILDSEALRIYRDDHAQTSITNRSGHDSLGRPWVRSHFAIALMLAGPAGTDVDVKRTVYRLRLLLDATTDQ